MQKWAMTEVKNLGHWITQKGVFHTLGHRCTCKFILLYLKKHIHTHAIIQNFPLRTQHMSSTQKVDDR